MFSQNVSSTVSAPGYSKLHLQQPSQRRHEEWSVEVYRRRTNSRDWEHYIPSTKTNDGKPTPSPNYMDEKKHLEDEMTACPKHGRVEVRKLRLRIHLFPPNAPPSYVKRRLDTLLFSTRRGVIVLKFKSISNCLKFSDALVAMNPSKQQLADSISPPPISGKDCQEEQPPYYKNNISTN
eukprot:CAMPEP_0194361056 /NCGR_PEP_ID=MMETSP0174-20130528/8576_1 /TAXON_ID=216777 /ORGANISM="Proboscia alata, Strain PI-D3" /LENGTH=178 /DNA_ID=CAMNT_0039133009 /DNA_START=63 /DNA_END=596 /DNA_ORIENTATION=-